jgi:asparagine synthase (glutamine-hydrolysing)
MCGIVGIVAADGVVDPPVLQRMNDLLAHRGPDGEAFVFASGDWAQLRYSFRRRADEGVFESPVRIGLGHRRLAILDLSDRGLQPMSTRDGRTWVVFNGEIYNHLEIKTLLESKGHVFLTRTDTEVLLNAYCEWGAECLARLDGMFAFAVWDHANGRLFCARDRLGIKPFYYATPGGNFVFASEIKALLAFPRCLREADDQAAVGFLVHGNCDFAERTLFRGIQALPAAHTMTVDAATGHTSIRRYWHLDPHSTHVQSDAVHVAQLREALVETVRTHLISDVRVGSCLSGGLDSSTVVGVIGKIRREHPEAAAAIGEQLFTFTSCYDDKALDEREYALEVASLVGAKPHLVFPSAHDFWSDFHRMAWHQDMPFSMLNFYAQWRVMRAAKEAGVKVLIDGQGGDEVFGGYAKFRYAYIMSLLRGGRLTAATRELTGMLRHGDRYILDIRNGSRYLPARLRRALKVDSVLQRVVTGDWNEAVSEESTPGTRWWRNALQRQNGSGSTLLQRIQVDDIAVDTLPQLLRMEDRSSMAFSLEARVPLLDHKVVEMGLSLPDHLKVNQGWSKFAVRQAMTGQLPESIRLRTTKLGFAAPDRAWLAGDLRAQVTELLASDLRCRRYVDVSALRSWHASPDSKDANGESFNGLFRILSLEMWMRAFSLS